MIPKLAPHGEDEPWWRIGISPDAARQPAGSAVPGPGFRRVIVEFDDQGCLYDQGQMQSLIGELAALHGRRAIVLVFVHGWKHNARDEDPNLCSFDKVLEQTASAERLTNDTSPRPVLGVFVGWRGMSFHFGLFTNLTFWNRKTAALHVALGSVRELFGRLRAYRDREDEATALVIVGHSFGGLVVYSALAQSLIEAASVATAEVIEPSFADLVVLINPAFEATRYLPIHSLVRQGTFAHGQKPICISITAGNDDATGLAFPAAAWPGSLFEHTRTREAKEALIRTMGHLPWMQTHTVRAPGASLAAASVRVANGAAATADDAVLAGERSWSDRSYRDRTRGWTRNFDGGAVLEHIAMDPNNPFWVVRATEQVINGHNGIFGDVFLGFLRKLVAEQLR